MASITSGLPAKAQALAERLQTKNGMIALGVGALVIAVLGGLFFALSASDELATREYARLLCSDVLKPYEKAAKKIGNSHDMRLIYNDNLNTQREAERAITASKKYLEEYRMAVVKFGDFSDDHVLRGSDGEDFQVEVEEAVADGVTAVDDTVSEIDGLDPADEEEVAGDISDAFKSLDQLDISVADNDPGGELQAALFDRSDTCGATFSGMVQGSSGGE